MSNELFPLTAVTLKSPRLKWMERHDLHTNGQGTDADSPWSAWKGTPEEAIINFMNGHITCAETEDKALLALCKNLGLKLWNEE